VELLNALRREGALVPDGEGWRGIRPSCAGSSAAATWSTARNADRGAAGGARELLEVMACLGGDVGLDLSGLPPGARPPRSTPGCWPRWRTAWSFSTGGAAAASFRHDRVQQAAYARMDPPARDGLHLAVARRLAAEPDYALAAAQQYLAALDAVTEPGERRAVASLLRGAATAARTVTNHTGGRAFLAAAIGLLAPTDPAHTEMRAQWHAALCDWAASPRPTRSTAARSGRAGSGAARRRGLRADRQPGQPRAAAARRARSGWACSPARRRGAGPGRAGPGIGAGLASLYAWLAGGDAEDDLRRPEVTDPRLVAAARLINRLMMPAFFADQTTMVWLVMRAGQMWAEHGPAAALVGPFSHAAFVTIPVCGDYRAGYQAVRRVVAVGEARGYEPDTSQAKFLHALGTLAWFEPLENAVRTAHEASRRAAARRRPARTRRAPTTCRWP